MKIVADIVGITGAITVSGGVGLIHVPSGIIVFGVLMVSFAILLARGTK